MSEVVDEVIQLVIGYGSIDPAIQCCHVGVEVIASQDDLQCSGSSHHQRKSLECAAAGKHARPDLWLPEYGLLSAGKS
jgi:hypothetical protein